MNILDAKKTILELEEEIAGWEDEKKLVEEPIYFTEFEEKEE